MLARPSKKVRINGSAVDINYTEGLSGKENPLLKSKLIDKKELQDLGEFLRRRGKKVVFTTGVFDMIHIGHSRYMQLARNLGGDIGCLVVGLNSDASVKALKGPTRPILPEVQRAEMLSFLQFIDYITIFGESNGSEVIKILKPNIYLCVEGSWEGDIATKSEVKTIRDIGGSVYYTPRQEPSLSTTDIIGKIQSSRDAWILEQFQEMLKGRKNI